MIYSDRTLSQRLELSEARANADFVESRAQLFPDSGASWIEIAGAYAMFDGIQSPCTQTFGLGTGNEISTDELESIESFFRQKNAPIFHEVSPLAHASLFSLLNERHYNPIEYSTVMFMPLNGKSHLKLNPEIITRKISQHESDLWAETSAKGWSSEMPEFFDFMIKLGKVSSNCKSWHSFLAELHGKPIATGSVIINDRIALIAGDSTLLESRGQGAQTTLLAARLKYAYDNGCDMAMMVASPGSKSQINGEKNGFRIAYTRTKWHLQ